MHKTHPKGLTNFEGGALVLCLLLNEVPLDFILPHSKVETEA
jgi:hypothetical protein